jgi:hypothetical protein
MPAAVGSLDGWHILDAVARIQGPFAIIDILKPHRIKTLVEALQRFPDVAPGHQERARRLLHRT